MVNVFRNMIIGTIVLTLFSLFILIFVLQVGGYYGVSTEQISSESGLDFVSMNETLKDVGERGNTFKESFSKQTFPILAGYLVVSSFFDLTMSMFNFILSPITLFNDILVMVLGVPEIVSVIIIFLVIVLMIFGVWRLIKQGD